MSWGEKKRKRRELLDEIIGDLQTLKARGGVENTYAIDENIKFFEAFKTLRGYIKWIRNEKPKIDGSHLLELSDLHLHNGKWERILQQELLEIEKWKFPDNLLQFRKGILKQIKELPQKDSHLILVSLGSGPMELERQIIQKLRKENSEQKIIFIGLDSSQESLDTAKNNLAELNVKIIEANDMDSRRLEEIKQRFTGDQYGIVLFKGDAMKIGQYFSNKSIDLIHFSRFRHHLPPHLKEGLDSLLLQVTNRIVEWENINNMFMFIAPLILRSRWNHPVLLNGAMFSNLRCPTKKYLKANPVPGWQVKYFPDGCLRVYGMLLAC